MKRRPRSLVHVENGPRQIGNLLNRGFNAAAESPLKVRSLRSRGHNRNCQESNLSAHRGDRTHLKRIKNPLPHQSAWRAWSSLCESSFLITSTIRFSKAPASVDAAALVGRLGIEPSWLKERLVYSQARLHSGLTTHIQSGRRELNPSFRHGKAACHHNTSTAGHTSPVEPPSGVEPEPAPYKSAALPMSYEGVSSRPPTDRTPLLGFGDQAGPRPWPRRSCSCVRRACPASSLSCAFRALRSVPETPKGREPCFGSPALGSILNFRDLLRAGVPPIEITRQLGRATLRKGA